jgi:hypothetical protein
MFIESGGASMSGNNINRNNDPFTYWLVRYGGIFIFAGFALVSLWIFQDFGLTWDEKVQSEYGSLALHYLRCCIWVDWSG